MDQTPPCPHVIRWYLSKQAMAEAPCAMVGDHSKHRTAAARDKMKRTQKQRVKNALADPERARRHRATAAASKRRKYQRDPEFRKRNIAKSAEWIAAHPLQNELYRVRYHSAGAQAKLDDI
jgi:hypothetical protein